MLVLQSDRGTPQKAQYLQGYAKQNTSTEHGDELGLINIKYVLVMHTRCY